MEECSVSNLAGQPHPVTLDVSFVIGLCAKEPAKYAKAQIELSHRIADGCTLHAPHLMIMEVTFVLCGKLQAGDLTFAEHASAIANLYSLSKNLTFPSGGDIALLLPAEQIRSGYGCSRSADRFYVALAELLAASGPSELLTFDAGQQKQAAAISSTVTVTLLVA